MGVLGRPAASSDAVVLRTWPTGETSLVVSLLTAEHGYVKVIAKGARGERSTLRPLVRPGCLANLEYSLRPDRELQYLKGGQLLEGAADEPVGLEETAYRLAALDLVDRCRPGDERDRLLFDLCRGFLGVLSSSASGGGAARFYAFELALLDLHGMAPELEGCAECGAEPDADGGTFAGGRFSPGIGGVLCRACVARGADSSGDAGRPLSAAALDVMRRLSGGAREAEMDRAVRREVGIHLHSFLTYHVPTYRLPAALELLRPRRGGRPGAEAPEKDAT